MCWHTSGKMQQCSSRLFLPLQTHTLCFTYHAPVPWFTLRMKFASVDVILLVFLEQWHSSSRQCGFFRHYLTFKNTQMSLLTDKQTHVWCVDAQAAWLKQQKDTSMWGCQSYPQVMWGPNSSTLDASQRKTEVGPASRARPGIRKEVEKEEHEGSGKPPNSSFRLY